ncbi:hypothetical protein COCOBI_02-6530 [Coccomyxa sp. Obi]|nr:hypothetical protein COCOBI_02-6530 [Coccomyxa sp. Obi]
MFVCRADVISATVVAHAAGSFDEDTLFINMAVRSGGNTVYDVLHGPLSIAFGILAGGVAGVFCSATNLWNNNMKRTLVIFLTSVGLSVPATAGGMRLLINSIHALALLCALSIPVAIFNDTLFSWHPALMALAILASWLRKWSLPACSAARHGYLFGMAERNDFLAMAAPFVFFLLNVARTLARVLALWARA